MGQRHRAVSQHRGNGTELLVLLANRPPVINPLFPYTTLFRSVGFYRPLQLAFQLRQDIDLRFHHAGYAILGIDLARHAGCCLRSEEHTSELQSRRDLVCRLLLEKKKWGSDTVLYRNTEAMAPSYLFCSRIDPQ